VDVKVTAINVHGELIMGDKKPINLIPIFYEHQKTLDYHRWIFLVSSLVILFLLYINFALSDRLELAGVWGEVYLYINMLDICLIMVLLAMLGAWWDTRSKVSHIKFLREYYDLHDVLHKL